MPFIQIFGPCSIIHGSEIYCGVTMQHHFSFYFQIYHTEKKFLNSFFHYQRANKQSINNVFNDPFKNVRLDHSKSKMASQQNYMIVDGVLKDLVEGLATYFDTLSPVEEGAESLSTFVAERIDNEDQDVQEEIFSKIAEKSSVLASAPEKDFESSYNLVLHILTFSSNLTGILPTLLKNLSKTPSYPNGPVLVLAVLSNLFNILPVSSPLRYDVFLQIIDTADATDNFGLIIPQLRNLPTWIAEWGISESAVQQTYIKISSIISKQSPETAYKYLFSAVSTSNAPEPETVTKLIVSAIQLNYDFDDILGLKFVQEERAKNPTLFELLETVSNGDYQGFQSFAKSNASFFTEHNIDVEQLTQRVRILALARFAGEYNQKTIPYSDISKSIEVPTEDVEFWIIDSIRAGLIEGRLNQIEQSVSIHRVSPVGKFGTQEWQTLAQKLKSWKQSVRDILDVLRSARENAQREEEKLTRAKIQQQNQLNQAQAQSV